MSEERIAELQEKISRDGKSQFGPSTFDISELCTLYERRHGVIQSDLAAALARARIDAQTIDDFVKASDKLEAERDAALAQVAVIKAAYETETFRDGVRVSTHARLNLEGAIIDLERHGKADAVSLRTLHRVAEQLGKIEDALSSPSPADRLLKIEEAAKKAEREEAQVVHTRSGQLWRVQWARFRRLFRRREPCNLLIHAKREMEIAGLFRKDSDYGGVLGPAILKMVKAFSDEGHSGYSAGMAVSIFEKVARFEPLTPLTGADDEWNEVGNGVLQNRRCSHVFKTTEDGAYDIDGIIWEDADGCRYTNFESRVAVTFPYTPTRRIEKRPTVPVAPT